MSTISKKTKKTRFYIVEKKIEGKWSRSNNPLRYYHVSLSIIAFTDKVAAQAEAEGQMKTSTSSLEYRVKEVRE